MFIDILFAFAVALFFQIFSFVGKMFERLLIIASCLTIILVYFYFGHLINNPFNMDFLIWLLFVIIFKQIILMVINIIKKRTRDIESDKTNLTNYMYEKLKDHVGHNIVCVTYGDTENPYDVCLECESCNCVLVSSEDYDKRDVKNTYK